MACQGEKAIETKRERADLSDRDAAVVDAEEHEGTDPHELLVHRGPERGVIHNRAGHAARPEPRCHLPAPRTLFNTNFVQRLSIFLSRKATLYLRKATPFPLRSAATLGGGCSLFARQQRQERAAQRERCAFGIWRALRADDDARRGSAHMHHTLHRTPFTQHPSPHNLHPAYTLHPTPYT